MAAPSFHLTNYFNTGSDPAGDILTLIENELALTEWTFVETVTYTTRTMRIWKCPASLNAAGVDFYIGLIKNTAVGAYIGLRAFETWNTTTKVIGKPVLPGSSALAAAWTSVAYGNGMFVAVGTGINVVNTSTDGITWTPRLLPVTANWTCVTYGGGTWVMLAGGGGVTSNVALTSTDGITWTQRTMSATAQWSAIAYGNGTFMAVTGGSAASTTGASSPDGTTWTSRNLVVSATWASISYGNGVFVAVASGTQSTCISSPTGVTWTSRTLPAARSWTAVAYGNATFVALTNTADIATSPDGTTWTLRAGSGSSTWNAIVWTGTQFVATAVAAVAPQTSPDGITWTAGAGGAPATSANAGLAYGGGTLVNVNGNLGPTNGAYSSTNVTTWTARTPAVAVGYGIQEYTAANTQAPAMIELNATLSLSTSFDVGVLVSRSYVAIAINTNGTGAQVLSWVAGLYQPAYTDSQSTNPPLFVWSIGTSSTGNGGGVSRSMRVPVDATFTFAAAGAPEMPPLGAWTATGGTKEPVTQSIRGSRVAVVAANAASTVNGFTATGGGYRGWMYDSMMLATTASAVKIADTATVGSTVWTGMGQTAVPVTIPTMNLAVFFNTTAGS